MDCTFKTERKKATRRLIQFLLKAKHYLEKTLTGITNLNVKYILSLFEESSLALHVDATLLTSFWPVKASGGISVTLGT